MEYDDRKEERKGMLRRDDLMYLIQLVTRRMAQAPTLEEQNKLDDLFYRILLELLGESDK